MTGEGQDYELVRVLETAVPMGPPIVQREVFGIAPCLDDVPQQVTDTEGVVWVQAYLDTLDRFAIYTRRRT